MPFKRGIGFVGLASMVGVGCSDPSRPPSLGSSFTLTVSAPTAAGGTAPLSGEPPVAGGHCGRVRAMRGRRAATEPRPLGLDTTVGSFSFTVFAPGFVAVTDLGLTQGGAWNVTLSPLGDPSTRVDVAGIVRGKQDAEDFVIVSASVPSSNFDGMGPEYAIRVEPGAPFSVIVSEVTYGPSPMSKQGSSLTFKSWAQFTSPAVSSVTNLDLALPGALEVAGVAGQSLVPSTVQGTLQVPASMAGARGGVFVSNAASSTSLYLGAATSVDLAPDGTNLSYDAEWVSPVSDLVTFYSLSLDGASSYVRSEAPPGGTIAFLDPPSVASPLPLYGDVAVTTVNPPPQLWLNILRDGESTVWRVYQHGREPGRISGPAAPVVRRSPDRPRHGERVGRAGSVCPRSGRVLRSSTRWEPRPRWCRREARSDARAARGSRRGVRRGRGLRVEEGERPGGHALGAVPGRFSRRVRVADDAPRLERARRFADSRLRLSRQSLRSEPGRPVARAGGPGRLGRRLRRVRRRAPRHRPRLRHLHNRAQGGRRVVAPRLPGAGEPLVRRGDEHLPGRSARVPRGRAGAVARRPEELSPHVRGQRPGPRHRPDAHARPPRLRLRRLLRNGRRHPLSAAPAERRGGGRPRLGRAAGHRVLLGLRCAIRHGAPFARRPVHGRPGVRRARWLRPVDRALAGDGRARGGRVPRCRADTRSAQQRGADAPPAGRSPRRRHGAPPSSHGCAPQDLAAIPAFGNTAKALLASSPSPRQSQVLYWNVVSSDLWESPAPTVDAVQARCDALSICAGGMVANAKVRALWPSIERIRSTPGRRSRRAARSSSSTGRSTRKPPSRTPQPSRPVCRRPTRRSSRCPSARTTRSTRPSSSPDDPPCGYQLVQSFLAHPDAPDTSCVGLGRPVSFEPGADAAQRWSGVDDFWGDAPATDAGPLAEGGSDGSAGGLDASAGEGSPDAGSSGEDAGD